MLLGTPADMLHALARGDELCDVCAATVILERERAGGVPAAPFCPRCDASALSRNAARGDVSAYGYKLIVYRDVAVVVALVLQGRIVLRRCEACLVAAEAASEEAAQ